MVDPVISSRNLYSLKLMSGLVVNLPGWNPIYSGMILLSLMVQFNSVSSALRACMYDIEVRLSKS